MPTINKRFLLKLALVVVALAGVLLGVHTVQARRIPDALRRQAERALDDGKTDQAVSYLRKYLDFEPDDVEAHEKLAELLERRSSRPSPDLVFLYDKILRLDPDREPVRRKALALCLRIARYSDAQAHAEALLKTFPNEPVLWQQLGAAQTGLNQLHAARDSYERSIKEAPDQMLGYQRLAQLVWRNMNDPAGAKAVLDRMVKELPQDAEAYLVRARFETYLAEDRGLTGAAAGNVDRALKDLQRVLELDPENAEASRRLAEILQRGRDVTAAHAILRDAVATYPKDMELLRSLAWMELVRGNVPAAIAVLEDGLKQTTDGFDLLVPLADLLVQQGETTRTEEILQRLEVRKAPSIQVKYLKARLAMRQTRWTDAVAVMESLRADLQQGGAKLPGLEAQLNLLTAACFQHLGDAAAEEKAYRRVADADPGNVSARVGLATLYMNQGKFDEAAREYEVALTSPYAGGGVVTQLIRLKARKLRLAGGSREEWKKLEQLVDGSRARFGPVSSDPVVLAAEVLAAENRVDDAIALLRKETTRRPGDARLWAVLAETTADAQGTAAGLVILDEAQAVAGDGPVVRLARARLYAREPGRIRPISPIGERFETWAEADQLRLLYGLVEVYDELGDQANVIAVLRRLAVHRPTDVGIWARLHERAAAAGDAKTLAEARAAVGKLDADGGKAALVCDAMTVLGADPSLTERLVAAYGPSPNRTDACLALARLREAAGDVADAIRLTERAFTLEPTRYETARAYIGRLITAGADDKASRLVTRLAIDPRWAGDPFRRLIGLVLTDAPATTGAKVIAWCRPLVEKEPGGFGWLAGCYAIIGKSAESEAALTAATRAPTATADDWLRLALSRPATAAQTLDVARPRLKPAAFFGLSAVVRETPAGKEWVPTATNPAEKRLFTQASLAVKLSRSDSAGAAEVLEQFLKAEPPAADAGWARRNLAMIYAVGGSPENRRRAMNLITDAADLGETAEELRATASVLTTLGRYLEMTDRATVLTRAAQALVRAHELSKSPKDLYKLSQLYRAAGNRVASRTCLQQLLNDPANKANLYFLVAAVEEVTEEGNVKSGESWCAYLLTHHPGEFRAIAAAARFECTAGRPEKALALAEGYTRAADVAAGDYLTRSARVAELLDELSRLPNVRRTPVGRRMTDAAVERYVALVPTRPEAVIAIAGALAADDRTTDAFARIDQYARYLTERTRAMAGLAAVRSGSPTDRQTAQVGDWLRKCLDDDRDSVALRLNMADYLTLRQKPDEAATAYEQVLARDPKNVVALNNMAWLMVADPQTAGRALELVDRATREVGLTGDLLDTRARVHITLKQFDRAVQDLAEAIRQEPTGLRCFHLALAYQSQSPAQPDKAAEAFREARKRGIDPKIIHPHDLPVFRAFEAGATTARP
jgi:tetratricopeptide (TPR) repeat protein